MTSGLNPMGARRILEYVQFTGVQCVTFGYTLTPRDRVEADFQFTDLTVQQRVFSQRPSSTGLHTELYINGSGAIGYAWEKDNLTGWKSNNTKMDTTRRTYAIDGPNKKFYGRMTINMPTPDLSSMTDEQCGTATVTIGRNSSSTPTHARVYGARMWKSGVLVVDFVPAMDRDGVACFLNRVNGVLKYPYVGGPLTAGPVVWS